MGVSSFHLDYRACLALLRRRLGAKPPIPIQILTGPRQVGKTTLLLALAKDLGARSVYVAGDAPEAALAGAWERLWARAAETAVEHGRAVLLIDEVQKLGDWAARLKALWDRMKRDRTAIHVVVSGSSALRLTRGSRESLAGRFERITLSHWPAAAAAAAFRIGREEAVDLAVREGLYPGAFRFRHDRERWTAYVRESIVEPAIGQDLLSMAPVRRPALLRHVVGAALNMPARIVSLQKLQGSLEEKGSLAAIAHYLALLEDAYLVAALEKHSAKAFRRRAAPPKLVALSNALLAVGDPRGAPDPERESERWGCWVENACLAFAWNSGQRVAYWREEPLEVDGVLDGSWGSWAVEVKTGPIRVTELAGLLEFVRRFPAYRPLVLCDKRGVETATAAGIPALDWRTYLFEGLRKGK